MKSTITALLLSCALSIISFNVHGQTDFNLTGKISLEGKKAESVKVLIYQDNDQISSFNLSKNSFNVDLPYNEYYTVKVLKEGYAPFTAFIDSHNSKQNSKGIKIRIDADLAKNDIADDAYYSDFPDTIFRFDQRTGEFIPSMHYTAHIMEKKVPLHAELEE